MIEELLPYYEKQLQEFGQQSREFAQKYPKIAQRLSLNQEQIDDPHIERLIQAFSLVAARVDKKLADSYNQFTHALFEVMFPQYLKPFPACSVVSFEEISRLKQLTEAHEIATATKLKSRSYKGVQCEFATTRPVRLLPIALNNLKFQTNPSVHVHLKQNATLSLGFQIFNHSHNILANEKLPLYLDAISNFPLQVLDHVFHQDTKFSLKAGNFLMDIDNPFAVMGFNETESVLPIDQHTHHAYRLLMEYFCFPEKFNFLNLNLSFLKYLNSEQSAFEVLIHFKLNLNDQTCIQNYTELNIANFKLFSVPVVNLFHKQAEPQKINHKQLKYPLITDAHHPEFYQVYSILEMKMIREKSNQDQVTVPILPFFGMSHYHHDNQQFFYSVNPTQLQNQSVEIDYSIISKHLFPQSSKSDFISTQLLCCNRDLPHEALSQANHVLNLNNSLVRSALILKRPSKSYYFEQNKKEQWRIISHLSLNTLSLMKGDAVSHIKELLELYNLSKLKENHLIIHSIKNISFSLSQKLVQARPFPLFVRGVKVQVDIDSQVFRGHSLYIFTQLLSHILNLKVQMNSYVDVIVCDSNSQQELYQCVQNVGGKKLL
ncbi:type VI secretion system baseplate subunit TssF [Acinetobacter bouvetii]|uniref:Type VI secretion system baseplate subunit TssF n=1 Tax=Acinetobacter bouvetii TaxID=202951 RepID=A0A811GEZ0_9GAMM|nr:type VI secretion system baseplate subunit TssF [Acinetobacter bouvetii]CAB1221472.1 hypothetical protein SFB21_2812 [Acinetobacter bouvetii]